MSGARLYAPGTCILLIALTSCAPALLWYGHDPLRTRRLELRERGGLEWLVEKGCSDAAPTCQSPRFDALVISDMVWSSDGRRFAVAAERKGRWHVVTDFVEGPGWEGVGSLTFSADGRHLAYAALHSDRWRVVREGEVGTPFVSVVAGSLAFSPDGNRFGYAAADSDGASIVIDGTVLSHYFGVRSLVLGNIPERDIFVVRDSQETRVEWDSKVLPVPGLRAFTADANRGQWAAVRRLGDGEVMIEQGEPVGLAMEIRDLLFSPEGRLAYTARRRDGWYFVLPGQAEGPYERIRPPVFSAHGDHYGYIAWTNNHDAVVMIDGKERGSWLDADGLVFNEDGSRCAYVIRRESGVAVVCDGEAFPFDVVVETAIGFSDDGAHWAALAGELRTRRLSIVVDGTRTLPFDAEEFFGAQAQLAGDSGQLRQWVVAELEHHLTAQRRKAE